MKTTTKILAIVSAIVDPTSDQTRRAEEEGRFTVSVPDNNEYEGDRYFRQLRTALKGSGWSADWTGDSNTDADGESTSDVQIQRDEEPCEDCGSEECQCVDHEDAGDGYTSEHAQD